VLAVSPDREAAVLLRVAGKGQDPLDGARALEKATKSPVVARTERITINGLPAAHTELEADGKVGVDVTWIAHEGTVFQVVGLAPRQRFTSVRPTLFGVAQTFRPLSAAERGGVTERRIRLITARAGETIDALASRSQSAWTREEIAVANGLAVGDRLAAGQVIKVAIAEPYRAGPGR
jgi:predicted Zn-dependent protease